MTCLVLESRQWTCSKVITKVIAVLVALPVLAFAQATISTGSIQGIVKDPSGALIAGAKIKITSQQTGQVAVLATDSAGVYASGALLPGNYVVVVESAGFKTIEVRLI